MRKLTSFALLLMTSAQAFALPTNRVPEPETLALVAIGVVAAFIGRKKR